MNPAIPVDELELLLKPLTKNQLLIEAEAWQAIVKKKAEQISKKEIMVKHLNEEIDKGDQGAKIDRNAEPVADKGESPENIEAPLKKAKEEVYFYADPPFSIRDGMDDIYEKTIKMIASIPSEIVGLVAIEHMTGLELPESIGDLVCVKSKRFGKTTLSYFEKSE